MPAWLLLAIGGTFVAVATGVASVALLFASGRTSAQRRLEAATASVRVEPRRSAGPATLTERPSRTVERIASIVPKSPKEMNRLRRRLGRAGFYSLTAAVVF